MDFSLADIHYYLPLVIVASAILVTLIVDMYAKSPVRIISWITGLSLISAAYYSLWTIGDQAVLFNGMLAAGGMVNIFYFLFTFGGLIVTFSTVDYIKKVSIYKGEYYILLLSAILGMMMLASAKDFVMIFIGLEQMSICFYILAGFQRRREKSNEAALKYFLLGSFATGFIVYGIALIYGNTGTLNIDLVSQRITDPANHSLLSIIGIVLFLIGFSFKIAAVPFHMWVPDVYQGSPTTTTAIMSTGGKTAAFAAMIVTLGAIVTQDTKHLFTPYISVVATLSMIIGSIIALSQNNIKRMLAYSSISHAGYMLIGLAAGNSDGIHGIVFYLAAYSFINLGAFGIIAIIESVEEKNLEISDYSGLGTKYPVLAALLALFMFSLSGIPPFAGFFGKYYVFYAALKSNLLWLTIVGVLSSVISVYFYLRVVVVMYFGKTESDIKVYNSNPALVGILISAILTVLMGVLPGSVIDLISKLY